MESKEFVTQLRSLVKIESVSSNAEKCRETIDWVQNNLNFSAKTLRYCNNNVETLVCGNGNLLQPDIAYIVHTDVVKAVSPDQYELKQLGDRLEGRGVSDMKFSVPIGIALLGLVIKDISNLDFALVVTTDEEVGGKYGVKSLVKDHGFMPGCVVVPDSGDNFVLIDRTKGLASVGVSIYGQAAHASQIWEGHSANHDLCLLGAKLIDKYGENNIHENWLTTMNMGVIQGGEVTNQVSSQAEMNIDFRFPESTNADEIVRDIQTLAGEIGRNISVSLLGAVSPMTVNLDHPKVKLFIEEFEKVVPNGITIRGGTGVNDARHFSGLGIPQLIIKPGGGGAHGADEWVSLDGCLRFYQAMKGFLKRVESE